MRRKAPDIEILLPALLRPLFPGVYIGRKAPTERRDRMVTIRRQGGPTSRLLDRPRIGVNVWAPTPEEANDLTADVAAAIRELAGTGDNPIKRASTYGTVEVPEESELHQRYFSGDLTVRTVT